VPAGGGGKCRNAMTAMASAVNGYAGAQPTG